MWYERETQESQNQQRNRITTAIKKIDKNTLNLYKSQVQHYPLIIYNNQ